MRHQLIELVLTVFKEETEALELLTLLSWAMPLMVYSTSLLDTLLMVLYQKWLHPWRRILAKVCASFPFKSIIQDMNFRRRHQLMSNAQ